MSNTDWTASAAHIYWSATMAIAAISSQSTQYVVSAISNTNSVDPTAASVSMAFLGPYSDANTARSAVVTNGTPFVTGSWGTTTSYPTTYIAQVTTGPSGTTTLTAGTYAVWTKISGLSNGETPVVYSGVLIVS